ncbi:MAG TPA: hypothetical protein PLM79_03695 [Syntrophobacteraceae bacterium]|nr:hypothetical protein [Syntrophobacteraceae bacterium]
MEEKQDLRSQWFSYGIKLALSFAFLFPVYFLLYVTFPGSLVALYFISAVLFAVFAPWDTLKQKFLS